MIFEGQLMLPSLTVIAINFYAFIDCNYRLFKHELVKLVLHSKAFNLFIETQILHSEFFISFSKVTQSKQFDCFI